MPDSYRPILRHGVGGHGVEAPAAISPRGWRSIVKRTAQKFGENELMSEAAGVTFYAPLSLVPAITALVSLHGLVAEPQVAEATATSPDYREGALRIDVKGIEVHQVRRVEVDTTEFDVRRHRWETRDLDF